MNTARLISPFSPGVTQLCVMADFHMGDFVRDLLEERKQLHRAVAEGAGMSPGNFSDMLKRMTIGDPTLQKVGASMGVDLIALVRKEQDRLRGVVSEVGEPVEQYGKRPVAEPVGPELVINLGHYPEEVQLKIVRFIQQQPKKSG